MTRAELQSWQLKRLNQLGASLLHHPLYAERLADVSFPLSSLDELHRIRFLNKSDLLGRSSSEPSRLFHRNRQEYVRFHQTSGSRGWPMPVLDTDADWAWWIECWQYVLDAAEVTASDVAMMAFSFGPFIGFWSANDALVHRGALVVPGGGLSTLARLKLLADQRCTVLCCTPTYALHMASVAKEHGINLADNRISRIIVAGEPGGSVPNVRAAIESQWNARVVDHAGASELGAWGFASEDDTGLHVIESEFITEVLVFQPDGTYVQAEPGQRGELVMTNLGRLGGPVMRYRTGDMVEPVWEHTFECRFVHLNGGVIGRADDMLVIRGVNVFPSSIESIVREIDPTAEFRMIASRQDEMDQLKIEIEADPSRFNAGELEERFRERLALRVPVSRVDVGTLPRSEGKSKRWVDERMDS
ncbi:acyl-CoA synthetase family protein [Neorhodopirellula pilleata]|nr:AMP-binding protein [Neorhodopirellula pilleata]